MQFVCSVNSKVVSALDAVTGKIEAGGDFRSFNNNWEPKELDALGIADEVGLRKGLCAWHLIEGKRVKDNTGLIQAGLIIIDIDNQADGKDKDGNKIQKQELTWEQAQELDVCKKYLSLAYDSPSTTESWPRFRLVFGLEKPIIDGEFYQWFTRAISKDIPGSDIRATQVPNLFYGSKSVEGILQITDKFIPAEKIDEALKVYHSLPKEEKGDRFDVTEALENITIEEDGIDFERLLARSVSDILDGKAVDDRSLAVTRAVKEILGWTNWLKDNGVSTRISPLTIAHRAFYAVYAYPAEVDGKFTRIVESIRDVETIRPAIVMASEHDDIAAWKRLKSVDIDTFKNVAPLDIQESVKQARAKAVDSILTFDDFSLNEKTSEEPTTTSTRTKMTDKETSIPETPAQLINLQNAAEQKRAFAENDVAEIIATNQGDNYLYDSTHDNFYTYDDDTGVWYVQDEMHVKRRIINALDTFVSAGVLPKYAASTVNSVYSMLQAKMLKSLDGGRVSIFSKGRKHIPFANGALDSDSFEFEPGKNKELYFRSRLLYEWDQDRKCPKFLAWMDSSLRQGQAKLIQAFARALLTGYTSGERFLHLVGPGGTGKSTMQQLMIALAGFNSTHTSSLELIEQNKFETYNLIGKRLLLLAFRSFK